MSDIVQKGNYSVFLVIDNTGTNNLKVNGVAVDARNGYNFKADQLENVTLSADAAASSQNIWIRAWDPTTSSLSEWDDFELITLAKPSISIKIVKP